MVGESSLLVHARDVDVGEAEGDGDSGVPEGGTGVVHCPRCQTGLGLKGGPEEVTRHPSLSGKETFLVISARWREFRGGALSCLI
jgi:hypothetical protein